MRMNYAIGGRNMSAIWGTIEKSGKLPASFFDMKEIYKRKCKLDRINEKDIKSHLFGCGIQHITEESKREQLPIYSQEEQLLFTSDCILDNRSELTALLGIHDPSTPDGTIMYYAYLRWGVDCVTHFHGLYSLAVYDIATDTLFLATDPTASRCLYYYQHENGCTFSTLLEPILQTHQGIQKNDLYLQDYLIAPGLRPNLSATETPYEGIYKLEAGTYVIIKENQKQIHRYWTPDTLPVNIENESDCKEAFLSTFRTCVHNAVRTSGELGIALSSGFDSSSVAALAAQELQKSSKSLYSYTYVPYYEQVSDKHESHMVINEQEAVQKTVTMYPNIKPKFLTTKGVDFYQSVDEILSIMEIPFKAFINLPSLQELFETASSNNCKVFLTGQYGNATISYGDIDNVLYDMYSNKHYVSYLSTLNQYCKKAKENRKKTLRGCKGYFKFTDSILKSPSSPSNEDVANPFLNKSLISSYPYAARYANEKLPVNARVALPKCLYEHYLYSTAALTYLGEYETKFGLANGIIIRDPTRDSDIISFCHSIPYKYFAYKGTPRWLVREGLKDYLPQEIIKPYFRYGLQNADWAHRVSLNWDSIYQSVKSNVTSPVLAKYIDSDIFATFFIDNSDEFHEDIYNQSIYLFILDILSRFLI